MNNKENIFYSIKQYISKHGFSNSIEENLIKLAKDNNIVIVVFDKENDVLKFEGAINDEVDIGYSENLYLDKREYDHYIILENNVDYLDECLEESFIPIDLLKELLKKHFEKCIKITYNKDGFKVYPPKDFKINYENCSIVDEISCKTIFQSILIDLDKYND